MIPTHSPRPSVPAHAACLAAALVALTCALLVGCAHAPSGWAPATLDAVRARRPDVVRVTGTERTVPGAEADGTYELRLVLLDDVQLVGVERGHTRAMHFALDAIDRIELLPPGARRATSRFVRDDTGLHIGIVVGILVAGAIAGLVAGIVGLRDSGGSFGLSGGGWRF